MHAATGLLGFLLHLSDVALERRRRGQLEGKALHKGSSDAARSGRSIPSRTTVTMGWASVETETVTVALISIETQCPCTSTVGEEVVTSSACPTQITTVIQVPITSPEVIGISSPPLNIQGFITVTVTAINPATQTAPTPSSPTERTTISVNTSSPDLSPAEIAIISTVSGLTFLLISSVVYWVVVVQTDIRTWISRRRWDPPNPWITGPPDPRPPGGPDYDLIRRKKKSKRPVKLVYLPHRTDSPDPDLLRVRPIDPRPRPYDGPHWAGPQLPRIRSPHRYRPPTVLDDRFVIAGGTTWDRTRFEPEPLRYEFVHRRRSREERDRRPVIVDGYLERHSRQWSRPRGRTTVPQFQETRRTRSQRGRDPLPTIVVESSRHSERRQPMPPERGPRASISPRIET
jgi:hypothetical protein